MDKYSGVRVIANILREFGNSKYSLTKNVTAKINLAVY